MNRADLIRLKIAGEALAEAAAAALADEARHEWEENDTAASWRTPAGTAYASIYHNRLEVVDEPMLLRWLTEHHPSEVVLAPAVRNPAWLKAWLEELAQLVKVGEADAPPGTKPVAGGDFKSLTIKPDGTVARLVTLAARDAVAKGEGYEVSAILTRADQLAAEHRTNGGS